MTRMWRVLVAALVALALIAVGCGSDDSTDTTDAEAAAHTEAAQLTEDWYAANSAYKNNEPDAVPVSAYYVPDGYHLYNDKTIDNDALAHHFAGSPGIDNVWVEGKEPAPTAAEPPCDYTLVGEMQNTIGGSVVATGELTFCVVTTDEGLRLHHTAWGISDLRAVDG
ncbi:MAG: hypothetical protein ACR2N2_03830 [Acidimicrobiia bacterium]